MLESVCIGMVAGSALYCRVDTVHGAPAAFQAKAFLFTVAVAAVIYAAGSLLS
jgi:hypothetical protein